MALLELLATIDLVSHTGLSGFNCEAVLKKISVCWESHDRFYPSNLSALKYFCPVLNEFTEVVFCDMVEGNDIFLQLIFYCLLVLRPYLCSHVANSVRNHLC